MVVYCFNWDRPLVVKLCLLSGLIIYILLVDRIQSEVWGNNVGFIIRGRSRIYKKVFNWGGDGGVGLQLTCK